VLSTGGNYGTEGFVYQDIANIPDMDGNYPIIGSWIIGGEAAGMGIRESNSIITDNLSRFVPHYFE
jgi:glutathionylspermidine synthase